MSARVSQHNILGGLFRGGVTWLSTEVKPFRFKLEDGNRLFTNGLLQSTSEYFGVRWYETQYCNQYIQQLVLQWQAPTIVFAAIITVRYREQ